jgi:hypothetical protein
MQALHPFFFPILLQWDFVICEAEVVSLRTTKVRFFTIGVKKKLKVNLKRYSHEKHPLEGFAIQ